MDFSMLANSSPGGKSRQWIVVVAEDNDLPRGKQKIIVFVDVAF